MARTRHRQPGATGFCRLSGAARSSGLQRGFTFFELLMIVVLIGMLATVMMPSLAPSETVKLDLVATEIADGMRFARSEALRLGVARGFRQPSNERRIRIFSMDNATSPATLVYDVYHPIDKQIYDKDLTQQPFAFAGKIIQAHAFRGNCDAPDSIFFDARGIPWCTDPDDVLLEDFELTLILGSDTRKIYLHGISGRVTVR